MENDEWKRLADKDDQTKDHEKDLEDFKKLAFGKELHHAWSK